MNEHAAREYLHRLTTAIENVIEATAKAGATVPVPVRRAVDDLSMVCAEMRQAATRTALARCPDCRSPLTNRTALEDGTPTYCDECDREVAS